MGATTLPGRGAPCLKAILEGRRVQHRLLVTLGYGRGGGRGGVWSDYRPWLRGPQLPVGENEKGPNGRGLVGGLRGCGGQLLRRAIAG